MDQDNIGLDALIGGIQLPEQLLRQAVEGLVLGHDLQVFIDTQAKILEHLLKHFPMLAGGADVQIQVRPLAQHAGQWRHFDCFGARAKHHHDCVRHCPAPGFVLIHEVVRSIALVGVRYKQQK
ncbi:hypothetical protein D3C84_742780 [compost metagenome]